MSPDVLASITELYFRTYVHATLPLHVALVELLCSRPRPPLELATVLEDIGQIYLRLADDINAALIERNMLNEEPNSEEASEALLNDFMQSLLSNCGSVRLKDGSIIDGQQAIEAFPAVTDAIRTALLLEADRRVRRPRG